MDRLEMVELIEEQAARLTTEGRNLAQRMELLTQALPGGGSERKSRNAPKRTKGGTCHHASGTSSSGC
jgi:hypothetical protein